MACPLDDRIIFPLRKYGIQDIPTSPSHWNTKRDIIYDFFNVANIIVVQHEYIFDPYALFTNDQNWSPVTVSAMVATHPELPPSFLAKMSRKPNMKALVSSYNEEIHSSLTQSYHAMMDALTHLGKNLPDFESDSSKPEDGNPLPETVKRATGRSHQKVKELLHQWINKCITDGFKLKCSKKEDVDSENWPFLYDFVRSVENVIFTESLETVYEHVFGDFCRYVLTRSDNLYLNTSKPQFKVMKKTKEEFIRFRPDLIVQNKLTNNHVVMIEVKKPRSDVDKTVKGEIVTSISDEDTLKRAQKPNPDPSPIAKKSRCDIDSSSDVYTLKKAQKSSFDPGPIYPSPSGDRKTPDSSDHELGIDDSVENLFPDSDLLEADENFLEDIEIDKSKCYRHLEDREKRATGYFLPQLLGEVFVLSKRVTSLFKHTTQKLYSNKNIRFGIGVVGFKVMFVAVCIVDQERKLPSPPTVTDFLTPRNTLRTDVFLTRQFSLLKSEDRKCIANMLFAICRSEELQLV